MRFILIGNPKSKVRHRVSKFGGMFDPQSKEKASAKMELMAQVAKAANSDDKEIVKNLQKLASASSFRVDLTFHTPPTKCDPWGLKECVSKKDLDNYIKWVADIANEILYSDDHKIVEIHARKCYNPYQKTIIDIEPMTVTTQLSTQQTQVLKIFTPQDCAEFLDDIGSFNEYSSADLEVMPEEEWQEWINNITTKKIKFARKWGNKLHKIAKVKDDP